MRVKTFKIAGETPRSPLAPLLRWDKGASISLRLTNGLNVSVDPASPSAAAFSVNLHTHGLHISSSQDDPTVRTLPGDSRDYRFDVLPDHAGGTHWYHSHVHGLGEFHSLASAAGPLLISDDGFGREIPLALQGVTEHVLQILRFFPAKLSALSKGYVSNLDLAPAANPRTYISDEDFSLNGLENSAPGFSVTTVNGYVFPRLVLEQEQWTRLRMIFISGDDPVEMIADGRLTFDAPPGACQYKLIAKDGVYLEQPREMSFQGEERIWLHPGSRADIFLRCRSLVTFRLLLHSFDARGTTTRTLPIVNISVATTSRPAAAPADFTYTACRPSYLSDLSSAVLASFPPNDTEITSLRASTEQFVNVADTLDVDVSPFAINGEGFEGFGSKKNLSVMQRGEVYQFRLAHGTHPLHVHVNHFQLQQDVLDGSRYHQRGDFVDTIAAPCPPSGCRNFPPRDPLETVVFRYSAHRFLGRVLFHCHNYDHADSGALAEAWIVDNNQQIEEDVDFAVTCPQPVFLQELEVTPAPSTAAPSTAAPSVDVFQGCVVYENQFFLGVDHILAGPADSARACVALCKQVANCSFAIYGERNAYCELWSAATVGIEDLRSGQGTGIDGLYSTYACSDASLATASPSTPSPTAATGSPSSAPSPSPSNSSSDAPSSLPSGSPTLSPTLLPTLRPTLLPTVFPSTAPSLGPSLSPSSSPSFSPTLAPSPNPTGNPSSNPTEVPSSSPSAAPSGSPVDMPTTSPSTRPSHGATQAPSFRPSSQPSDSPTDAPSIFPTDSPTVTPSLSPTVSRSPTDAPSIFPTDSPTKTPTFTPTGRGGVGTLAPTSFGIRERKSAGEDDGTTVAMIAVYAMVGFLFIFVLIVSRLLWRNHKEVRALREERALQSRAERNLPERRGHRQLSGDVQESC